VITNLATTQTRGKVANRPSTSFAAANVGNAKSAFLPNSSFDPATGLASANSSPISISGGQVHIKPVLRFGGTKKIMDDESMKKLKAGTYKVNGNVVLKNTNLSYEELLYGEEKTPGSIHSITGQAISGMVKN